MPRPKQRTPELKERLLAAAIGVLARDGVASLTTREVARRAGTSPPALYELFGDKAGLVRAIFLDGFRKLRDAFEAAPSGGEPVDDALALIRAFRRFARESPVLVEVMFSRPFADFRPGPEDLRAAMAVQEAVIGRVQRCIDAGLVAGDPREVAHAVMALVEGLAAAENAGRLGSPRAADRRWQMAVEALFRGLRPEGSGAPPSPRRSRRTR